MGEGKSSRVFVAREIKNHNNLVAIKVIRYQYLKCDRNANQMIDSEVNILKDLDHQNINKLIEFGRNGRVIKPSGKEINNLIYMVLEYTPKCLFDVCKSYGGLGESAGQFLMG